jgi:flagellin-specific chaperone FliS
MSKNANNENQQIIQQLKEMRGQISALSGMVKSLLYQVSGNNEKIAQSFRIIARHKDCLSGEDKAEIYKKLEQLWDDDRERGMDDKT